MRSFIWGVFLGRCLLREKLEVGNRELAQSGRCDCLIVRLRGKCSGSLLQRAVQCLPWLNQFLCVTSCLSRPLLGNREACRVWTNPALHGQNTERVNIVVHHSCANHWCVEGCIYWLIDCIDCLNWWKVQRQQTEAQQAMHGSMDPCYSML